MTQKEIEKFLANTKVYVNGKSKEIQEKIFSFGFYWKGSSYYVVNTTEPFLYLSENKGITYGDDMKFFTEHEYREVSAEEILSLELTEPTYRPFKDVEECWQEMLKHQPFGWLKKKKEPVCYNSLSFIQDREFELLFNDHTFADGTPFGIKEEYGTKSSA